MSEVVGVETVVPLDYSAALSRGLGLLRQAYCYANALERNTWDFAVELSVLTAAGMSLSDLRWLLCLHYLAHAEEIYGGGKDERQFVPAGNLRFSNRSCFVLTDGGAEFVERMINPDVMSPPVPVTSTTPSQHLLDYTPETPAAPKPFWDCQRRELRMGQWVIKRFKLPSPNQETLLAAFEEEGWPLRIDDPLPPVHGVLSKRRLHDTIKSLNRNQKCRLISFKGDGTGEGICWEPMRQAIPER